MAFGYHSFTMHTDINYRPKPVLDDRTELMQVITLHLHNLKQIPIGKLYAHSLCVAIGYPKTTYTDRIRNRLKDLHNQAEFRILDEQAIANLLEKLRRI